MTSSDTGKYMFDLNNFDSGVGFDPDNPPPPTFSQEELDTARAAGFAEGIKKGLADAQSGRDQQIVEMTRRLSEGLGLLIGAEETRARRFENELLALAHALYQKTFPVLNETYGLPQITATIGAVLSGLDETSMVVIEVAPQDIEDVSDRLKPFLTQHVGQITILAQGDVDPGSFRLKWKDGGAIRDTSELAEKLSAAITTTLAENQDNPLR